MINPATASSIGLAQSTIVLVPVHYWRNKAGEVLLLFTRSRERWEAARARFEMKHPPRPRPAGLWWFFWLSWALAWTAPVAGILFKRVSGREAVWMALLLLAMPAIVVTPRWLIWQLVWFISVPLTCLAALMGCLVALMVGLLFGSRIRTINEMAVRIYCTGDRVVLGSENYSLILHPSVFRLQKFGGTMLLCHSKKTKVILIIPGGAIPVGWVGRLSRQLAPNPAGATTAT